MVSSVAACCIRPTAHAVLCIVNGDDSALSFLSLVTLTKLTFELQLDFCTLQLTAKFHRPKFSRSEVIVRTNKQTTNKQTPLKTSTLLCYATPMGN